MFNAKNRSVYIGYSIDKFNQIKNLLNQNHIAYKHSVKNHQNQWLIPGKITVRGAFGSLGTNLDATIQYEIKVSSKDFEGAMYLIEDKD